MTQEQNTGLAEGFNDQSKAGLYQAIYMRRDIRSQFIDRPIPSAVLARILDVAHHDAPSVGFMQPWNFILIRDVETRKAVHTAFERATEVSESNGYAFPEGKDVSFNFRNVSNTEAALMFPEGKRERYRNFKLEGILESPLNVCVTCDRSRSGPVVIGRTANRVMLSPSPICASDSHTFSCQA